MIILTLELFRVYLYFKEMWNISQMCRLIKQHRLSSLLFKKSKVESFYSLWNEPFAVLLNKCPVGSVERNIICDKKKWVRSISPQISIDLSQNWTRFIDRQDHLEQSLDQSANPTKYYFLIELKKPDDEMAYINWALNIPEEKRIMIQDHASLLAWKAQIPYSVIAEATHQNLTKIVFALMDDLLLVEDMMEIEGILTVKVTGQAAKLLATGSATDCPMKSTVKKETSTLATTEPEKLMDIGPILESNHETASNGLGSNESLAHSVDPFSQDMNFDLYSGKPIGVSALQGFDDTASQSSSIGSFDVKGAGEAPSDPIELLAPEMMTPVKKRTSEGSCKPPNVLIYCGKKDSTRLFNTVKSIIEKCINPSKYVIYHLKHEQIQTIPWRDNTALLIIASNKVYDNVDQAFLQYFQKGGVLASFSSAFDDLILDRETLPCDNGILMMDYKDWKDVSVICGKHSYPWNTSKLDGVTIQEVATERSSGKMVVVESHCTNSGGVALLSQVNLDKDPMEMAINPDTFLALKKSNSARFEILTDLFTRIGIDCTREEIPDLTPAILFASQKQIKDRYMQSLQKVLKDGKLFSRSITLHFRTTKGEQEDTTTSDKNLDVILTPESATEWNHFDFELYCSHLKTRSMGQIVCYIDVVTTTMDIIDSQMFAAPQDLGLLAVARMQTQGKGRGGNAWISPIGCAMFSLHVRILLSSRLGQAVSFLQHMVSLAVVQAVRTIQGYEDIDLRLKWPNDIYAGKSVKIGGVIVQSSVMQDVIHANIGCGFNVDNKDPTMCINDLVLQHNEEFKTDLKTFTTEEVLARTVTKLEEIIDSFQKFGKGPFLDQYYQRWLHSDAVVTMENEEVTIQGLDEYGYLSVVNKAGKINSVQPDGNSFDMMKNLITFKVR